MDSVLQTEKECLVCKSTQHLHSHHCFPGTSNRKKSEKYGLKVWLCAWHHNGSNNGVHFNRNLDLNIKKFAQKHFEEHTGTREEFIKEFGKSFL